jgi:hypothetical protein
MLVASAPLVHLVTLDVCLAIRITVLGTLNDRILLLFKMFRAAKLAGFTSVMYMPAVTYDRSPSHAVHLLSALLFATLTVDWARGADLLLISSAGCRLGIVSLSCRSSPFIATSCLSPTSPF